MHIKQHHKKLKIVSYSTGSSEQQLKHLVGDKCSCFHTSISSLDLFCMMIQIIILALKIGHHDKYTDSKAQSCNKIQWNVYICLCNVGNLTFGD